MTINDITEILTQRDDILLCDGVSDDLISDVETTLCIQLPDAVKQFYKFSNGLETDEYMFNIIKLEDIIENKIRWKESELFIAEILIYSDTWHLEVDQLNSADYTIFNTNEYGEKITLTKSFVEFLQRVVEGGVFGERGLYSWSNEIRKERK